MQAFKEQYTKCLICGGQVYLDCPETYSLREIFSWWQREGYDFSKAVLVQFDQNQKVSLHVCSQCGFGMFLPPVTGTDQFYAELASIGRAWYYLKDKWEYWKSLQDLQGCSNILDVGCGEGYFLELAEKRGIKATGLELNSDAVDRGRANGLNIVGQSIEEFSFRHPCQFDAVTLFQVLEHLKNPAEIFYHALQCLKPSGKVVISVPSTEGVLRYLPPQLANIPPHHISRWSGGAIQALAAKNNLRIFDLRQEPFSHYGFIPQVAFEYIRRKKGIDFWNAAKWRWIRKVVGPVWRIPNKLLCICFPRGIPFIYGHSLYAVLQK